MILLISFIEFVLCYVTHSKMLLGKHLIIQVMGLVIDLIIAFMGFGALRFVPLIIDIIVQIGGRFVCRKYYPDEYEYICEAGYDHDIIEDFNKK